MLRSFDHAPELRFGTWTRIRDRSASGASDSAKPADQGLLGGESPTTIDAHWSDDLAPLLHGSHADFGESGASEDDLAAKTAPRILSAKRLERLDERLLVQQLTRVGEAKAAFNEEVIDPIIARLTLAWRHLEQLRRDAETAREVLLVKNWPMTGTAGCAASERPVGVPLAGGDVVRRGTFSPPNAAPD